MTTQPSLAPGSSAHSAAVVRRLVTFAMTAAMLSLAGCGDSGDDSDTDESHTGCRSPNQIESTCRACTDFDGRCPVSPMLINPTRPAIPVRDRCDPLPASSPISVTGLYCGQVRN
jgi:hypothetical protein